MRCLVAAKKGRVNDDAQLVIKAFENDVRARLSTDEMIADEKTVDSQDTDIESAPKKPRLFDSDSDNENAE